jgi:hypothetical protein
VPLKEKEMEKQVIVDKIEVTANGSVQVRTATIVRENGVVIGQSFNRHVIAPGGDYSNEDAKVQAICSATHTPEVTEAYKAATAAQGV